MARDNHAGKLKQAGLASSIRHTTGYPIEELEPWDFKPRKRRRRNRKPTLASVARQAAKAGIEVARYEIDQDGKIIIVTGKTETTETTASNPWDEVLTHGRH